MDESRDGVALVTRDEELADMVLSAAAAVGVDVGRADAPPTGSSLALVGLDAVRDGMAPPGDGVEVVLVGEDADELARCSVPWRARVVVLPEGRAGLTALLGQPGGARARVVAVVGGSGGVGTSTVAAGVALTLAGSGTSVALVDLDDGSGGLDLLLGAEATPGWRWPSLLGATGELGDLAGSLVEVGGVHLLSHGRTGEAPGAAAVTACVRALARSHDVVLLDVGRAREDVARLSDRVLLVGTARVAGVAAACRAAARWRAPGRPAGLVLRQGPVPADDAASAVGLALLGVLPDDDALARAAEDGVLPGAAAGRRWRRKVGAVAEWVVA